MPILKKIISSRPLLYLLVLLLIFALVSLGREINRRLSLKGELVSLEGQIATLETENQKLIDEIEKAKTDYFKERAARLNLGLQRPGEQVIVISPQDNGLQESESETRYFEQKISNLRAWWRYFFRHRK